MVSQETMFQLSLNLFENILQKPFFFDLNFHKKEMTPIFLYNPNNNKISRHLDTLKEILDLYSAHYESPSYTDLILSNSHHNFQNSRVIETGLSDFHKMIVSVRKTFFSKLET